MKSIKNKIKNVNKIIHNIFFDELLKFYFILFLKKLYKKIKLNVIFVKIYF